MAGRNLGQCKKCSHDYYIQNKSKIIQRSAKWKQLNPVAAKVSAARSRKLNPRLEESNIRSKARYYKNLETSRNSNKERARRGRAENPMQVNSRKRVWAAKNPKSVMMAARSRAKKQNLPFDLCAADFEIPETCPVFGFPLIKGVGGWSPTSPSLDKIIPNLGYVRGNVRVISWRANCLKRDATAAEVEMLNKYMQEIKVSGDL